MSMLHAFVGDIVSVTGTVFFYRRIYNSAYIFVTVFGQTIIILNSSKAAVELLDGRSAKYSDRPVIPMGGELVGWNRLIGLLPYGDRFKKYRRLAKQLFGTTRAMAAFYPVEEEETHQLLKSLALQPDKFIEHVQK